MITIFIAAAALADTSGLASEAGPAADSNAETIVVEGRRSARSWDMPKLEYDEPASCPALVETEIPGFGVMRLRKRCAGDQAEEWRLFQY